MGKDTQELIKCCICGQTIKPNVFGWKYGYNAWPIKDGKCCDICNDFVVFPARTSNQEKQLKVLQ